MDCFPPEGWEVLGYYPDVNCPEGYEEVNDLEIECRHFQNEHCCTEGHSGASGDCANLVINSRQELCAFVDNAAGADLPSGWKARPGNTPLQEWLCPYGPQDWVPELPAEAPSPLAYGTDKSHSPPGLSGPGALLLSGFCDIGPDFLFCPQKKEKTGKDHPGIKFRAYNFT